MMLAIRNGAFKALSSSSFAAATPLRSFATVSRLNLRQQSRLSVALVPRRGLTVTAFRLREAAAESEQPEQPEESVSVKDLPNEASVSSEPSRLSQKQPTRAVYVGNLLFDITEEDLRKEFGRFGDVQSVKLIYDSRGLSKGFGYVEFDQIEPATAAIAELNGENFEGRRLVVDYVLRQAPMTHEPNPPSKTLYIGNMSFEMSSKDLDLLFRDIKGVVDVRVAIDRRTGQPRGFAHADFLNVDAAVAAHELLNNKQVHGRSLKVDFSKRSREGRRIGEVASKETEDSS